LNLQGFEPIGFSILGINIFKANIFLKSGFGGIWLKEDKKITLPKETQDEMIKFFLKTSIPRKKQEKTSLLSEKTTDRSEKK